jgi:hypothetical protein
MTYHISKIINNSPKSAAITNPAPHSSAGWQDSHLVLPGTYVPERPIEVNFIRQSGTVSYPTAAKTALNIYTFVNNWCFWDNGNSALNGVADGATQDVSFYNGSGGNLVLTVNESGSVGFGPA